MHRALRLTARIALGFFAVLTALVLFAAAFLGIAEAVVDESAHVLPSYPRQDIREIVAKDVWTEEDISLLYRQTGLGRSALYALKGLDDKILAFQDALFKEVEIEHVMASFTTPHDQLKDFCAPLAPLEDGDVLVSSSCHTFGWRNGHSALVVNANTRSILQSVAPGMRSTIDSASWFTYAANFMVLRLKDASKQTRYEIALWAANHLYNVDYSILTGFFSSPKDQGDEPATTHCSHLVWQAFKHFGFDIDPDGGPVCTSRDIATSPLFEVVQVYGFDPERLWG